MGKKIADAPFFNGAGLITTFSTAKKKSSDQGISLPRLGSVWCGPSFFVRAVLPLFIAVALFSAAIIDVPTLTSDQIGPRNAAR